MALNLFFAPSRIPSLGAVFFHKPCRSKVGFFISSKRSPLGYVGGRTEP
jgi:hypothetical protein